MSLPLGRLGRSVSAAAVFFAPAAFGAEDGPIMPGTERFTVMLGAFLPAFKTKVEGDGDQTGGDRIDLGRDLGTDQNSSGGWFALEWRFAPRHRFGFTYSRFTLNGDRRAERDLHIGDKVFPIGAEVQSRLRLELIPITYSYSVIKQPQNELALTAGVHWDRLTFRVDASASIGGRSGSNEASSKANLPLPLLGVRYDHHFSERWSMGASAAAFSLKFAEETFSFEGSLVSARLHGEYRMTHHLALGAALDAFKVNAKASQSDWHGGMDYGYFGPQVYLTARF